VSPSRLQYTISDSQDVKSAMRLTLNSCGDEIATLDADPAWQLQDVLMTLSNRALKRAPSMATSSRSRASPLERSWT